MIEFDTEIGTIRVTQGEQYGDVLITCGESEVTVDAWEFAEICKIFLGKEEQNNG